MNQSFPNPRIKTSGPDASHKSSRLSSFEALRVYLNKSQTRYTTIRLEPLTTGEDICKLILSQEFDSIPSREGEKYFLYVKHPYPFAVLRKLNFFERPHDIISKFQDALQGPVAQLKSEKSLQFYVLRDDVARMNEMHSLTLDSQLDSHRSSEFSIRNPSTVSLTRSSMGDGLDDNAFLQLKQGFSKNKSLRVGTLYKKGKESGKFKKRKFILEHDRLVYSKDTNKKDRSFNFISLQGVSCKNIGKEARKHCFEICSGGNVYTLSAGSEFDMKGWMNAIWNQVLEVDQNMKIKKLTAQIRKAEEKKTKKDQELIKQLHTFDGIMANKQSRDLFFTFISEDTAIPEILDKIKDYRLQCLQNRERAKEIAHQIVELMKTKCLAMPQEEEAMEELKRPPIINRDETRQERKDSLDTIISYEEVNAIQRLMDQKCWSQQLFSQIEERVRSQLKAKYFKSFSRDPKMQRLIEFIPIQSFKLKLRWEPSRLLADTLQQVSSQNMGSKDDYLKGLLSNIV